MMRIQANDAYLLIILIRSRESDPSTLVQRKRFPKNDPQIVKQMFKKWHWYREKNVHKNYPQTQKKMPQKETVHKYTQRKR